jgi:hypothetical protein
MLLQKGERLRSEIRARLYPEPLHPCRGDGSDPVKFGDRQGCEELVERRGATHRRFTYAGRARPDQNTSVERNPKPNDIIVNALVSRIANT